MPHFQSKTTDITVDFSKDRAYTGSISVHHKYDIANIIYTLYLTLFSLQE